jgi:hypothetical protein
MAEYCLTSYTNKHNAATCFVVMERMQDHLLLHIASIPVRKRMIIGVKLNYVFSLSLQYRWNEIINPKAKD